MAWLRDTTHAKGNPFPLSRSHHSVVVLCPSTASIALTISALFSTLARLVAKRWSAAHSGLSKSPAEHSVRNCESLPAESIKKESAVGKTWYGTIEGCEVPHRVASLEDMR
jgi:hypothetical protein